MIILALFAITVLTGYISCSSNKEDNATPSKTFVIVHGAWQGPYAWQSVKLELEANGQKVILIQLAGHEKDQTDPSKITLATYSDQVVSAINKVDGPVVLVGHSLGGMVVSDVAERSAGKIDRLIYIAAYVPVSGQSLLDLAKTDSGSLLTPALSSPTPYTLDVAYDQISDIFIQDGSDSEKNLVLTNYRVEPAVPFTQPVSLTAANYGTVNKFYIHTGQDQAISPDLQKRMVAAAGIKGVYSLNTGHSPFLSMPDSVTALLLKIAK